MSFDATLSHQPGASAVRRIGTLAARSWRASLYAPASAACARRPEDLAAVQRAYHAGIVGPFAAPTYGFCLLRSYCEDGDLALFSHWWEGTELHRTVLLLLGCGSPPRRQPDAAECLGTVAEVLLMARQAMAWRRCVLNADVPSSDAYLAECCA
jgi:hypothetical protein